MAKNFAALYTSVNDSIALEQKIFLKEESVRGVLAIPTATDFLYTLSGGSVNFMQPIETSPHRSGRHHNNIIKQKTTTEWTLPTFFNIDTTLGAAAVGEVDPAFRLLHKAMFGKEDIAVSPIYDTSLIPDTTFSIYENGDKWAKQASGAFVESCNMTFPGDGQAQSEWGGSAKTALLVGIGKSVIDNNTGNDITLATGEGRSFPAGAQVMLVEADGTTRSADTPDGTPRTVVSVLGDAVTLDGAVLADADGSVTPIYLAYYEPVGATGIDNPQTGLVGSIDIAGFTEIDNCVRSASINCTNSHELQDFCYGEEGLGGALFTPGGRFTAEVSLELNLSAELVQFMNKIKAFDGENITLILGDSAGRHLQVLLPKVIFPVPEIAVPDAGTIPVTFTGNAYQTALDAADEIEVSYL